MKFLTFTVFVVFIVAIYGDEVDSVFGDLFGKIFSKLKIGLLKSCCEVFSRAKRVKNEAT